MNTLVILFIFIALSVILIGWIIRLEIKMSRLLAGKNGKSLEDSIVALIEKVQTLDKDNQIAHGNIENLRARMKKCLQRVETVRFNPFKGTGSGGNQSFVTAFSDEEGKGVVLSGLYARDGVSVYAKPIANFASEYQFSDEEKETVAKLQLK
ncbi:MAG: DUF4446 family protein [Candidatus Paceibacterota bacterium]|jgi:hypothetical protein|nr:DUF4446 family protein [Candidatus Paceibacterota bacterium]